jgi:tRNA (5-methylaminomethyl-2-thiouridylate)-methyltransferase
MGTKTAVLLSGGVDSSVALHEVLAQGAEAHAFYLKIWLEDELAYLGNCPWEEDLEYARAVCSQAGVPLKVVSLQQEYFDRVVNYAIRSLKAGLTPSPDLFCNQQIKFGAFFDRIDAEYERVASGHYAQTALRDGRAALLRSPDPVKDQTYFLSYMSQEQVKRAWFPIGGFTKKGIREKAQDLDLPNKTRKDSQGICFLGKIKYNDFVKHYLGEKTGEIREKETEQVLGEHNGFWFHTIGQRTGLGLGNGPWYVSGKDLEANIVYVTHKKNMSDRAPKGLIGRNVNIIRSRPEDGRYLVKLRHGPQLIEAELKNIENGGIHVELAEPDRGIAPGQFCVIYREDECLGAASIEQALYLGD